MKRGIDYILDENYELAREVYENLYKGPCLGDRVHMFGGTH